MVEARRLVSGDKTGILWMTCCDIWSRVCGKQTQKSLTRSQDSFRPSLWQQSQKIFDDMLLNLKRTLTAIFVCMFETFRMTLFVIRKGIFLTRSQDICRFVWQMKTWYYCREAGGLFKPRCGQKTWYLWQEGRISTAVFVELTGFLWQEVGTLTGLFVWTKPDF